MTEDMQGKDALGLAMTSEARLQYKLEDRLAEMPTDKFELTEEDRAWLDAPPVGREIEAAHLYPHEEKESRDMTTEAERRMFVEQVLANSRISGHIPSPEHLAHMEQYIRGEKTLEQIIEEIKAECMPNSDSTENQNIR